MAIDITGIGSLADLVGKVVDRVWPDATRAQEIKLELFKAEQAGALQELTNAWDNAKAQLAVNQAEAGTGNLFISGWRPFVGWVCGVAFAYKYIVEPILIFGFAVAGKVITLPAFDFTTMVSVLMGMLGLGAMRTYEKTKGVSVKG
jgi:hypothetical protein